MRLGCFRCSALTAGPERDKGRSARTSEARLARLGAIAQPVDEEPDHPLAVRGSVVAHRQAQTGDGVQEVLRADVGTNRERALVELAAAFRPTSSQPFTASAFGRNWRSEALEDHGFAGAQRDVQATYELANPNCI